jgi:predicted nucleic acid-binding protein
VSDVFLDTVGLLALLDEADQWHADADAAYERIKTAGRDFVTTHLIFLEAGNAAAKTPYRKPLNDIRREMTGRGKVFELAASQFEAAWTNYERGDANRAGIVDQVSFVVMRRLGLTDAFTNDQHFAAAGFTVLF